MLWHLNHKENILYGAIIYLWNSRLVGNLPYCPKTFQTIRKHSRLSRNFPDCLETFRVILCFDLILRQFCWDAKKLYGPAKTFWSAMPMRRPGFSASAARTPFSDNTTHIPYRVDADFRDENLTSKLRFWCDQFFWSDWANNYVHDDNCGNPMIETMMVMVVMKVTMITMAVMIIRFMMTTWTWASAVLIWSWAG